MIGPLIINQTNIRPYEGKSPILKSGKINDNIYDKTPLSTDMKTPMLSTRKKPKIEMIPPKNIFQTFNTEEEISSIRIQNGILEEYKKWTNILIEEIIKFKNDEKGYIVDGNVIHEGLETLENLKKKNLEIKSMIVKKRSKNEKLRKMIDKNMKKIEMIKKEYQEQDNLENLKKEKAQLTLNVQMLGNELDDLIDNNAELYDKIQQKNNLRIIFNLINERNELKEENDLQKKILMLKKRNIFYEHKNYHNKPIIYRNNDNGLGERKGYNTIGSMNVNKNCIFEIEENYRDSYLCGY